ncbi:MAG: hypothetical protein GC160_27750 [Acidobacteria bacterium]|nr:hypothetical protein [Acidobacteriota bacterium]
MFMASMLSGRSQADPDRALQRLAGAILIQALQDASNGPRRHREEALEWIQGRTKSGFTFEFCCSLLARDPDDVRERLKQNNVIPKWDSTLEDGGQAAAYAAGFNRPYSYSGSALHAKAS